MMRKLTTEIFIQRGNDIHGYGTYDYSYVEYTGIFNPVKIWCHMHGFFDQIPDVHINQKCGCPKCSGVHRPSTEEFIENAINFHGICYGYDKLVYEKAHKKVEIYCPFHRDYFWQLPTNHLKYGCAICFGHKKITTKKFIEKSVDKHGDLYDYTKVIYDKITSKVEIICKIHDDSFWQRPGDHLSGQGCPDCKLKYKKSESQWLKSLNIPTLEKQKRIYFADGKYAQVDGFDPATNTIYEYHGKFWHGHPGYKTADPDRLHPKGLTYGDRYIQTLNREIRLKELGYNVISIWV
jgi:hypothetical protein